MRILITILIAWYLLKLAFCFGGLFISIVFTRIIRKRRNNYGLEGRASEKEYAHSASQRILRSIYTYVYMFIQGYIRYTLLWVGRIPSHFIRNFLYRHVFCVRLMNNAVIYGGAEIRAPEQLVIGAGSVIGDESKLDARNGIEIGDNVNFSTGVWIWSEQHEVNSETFSVSTKTNKKVEIHNRVWLGSRVIVLPGVTIGEGAVVASGAIVTKDLVPFGIYAGIPAKKIGERNHELTYTFSGQHYYFW